MGKWKERPAGARKSTPHARGSSSFAVASERGASRAVVKGSRREPRASQTQDSQTRNRARLLAHDDTLASRLPAHALVLRLRAALRAVRVAAARALAVELDARAGARDAVALAGAAGARAGHGAGRAAVAAAGAERGHVGRDVRVAVLLAGRVAFGVADLGCGELGGELFDGWVFELLRRYLPCCMRFCRLRTLYL